MAHKLLIDINVILDVAGERQPHWGPSQSVLTEIEKKRAHGFVSATGYPILYYLLKKQIGAGDAREFLSILTELLSIVPVDKAVLERAMSLGIEDYEDAIQVACAGVCRAEFIVTRDVHGYKRSPIKAVTPSEYLATFSS